MANATSQGLWFLDGPPLRTTDINDAAERGDRRSVRSVARAVDRVDRFGWIGNFTDFSIFLPCRGARDLSRVKVSALCDAWRPKKCRNTETQIFGILRFGRFGIPFGSIDIGSEGRGGALWSYA